MRTARPADFPALLAFARERGAQVLSLDCFDTLVWRTVAHPTDVFNAPPMRLNRYQRMHAESEARKLERVRSGHREVTIEAIYRAALPEADADTIAAAVRAECTAEAAHCFAFAPTVALIRAAHAAGLRVIIVSDTYLSEAQLRALVERALGRDADVLALVERVFCSSAYGRSKGDGLFQDVLAALRLPPAAIVHLGDNHGADVLAPAHLDIHGVHFEQFPDGIEQQLRLEANCAALLDPSVRGERALYQPQRPLLATVVNDDAAWRLGFGTLGPVLTGFTRWLHEQAQLLGADGRPVKLLFMLRDGHLPLAVFRELAETLAGTAPGAAPAAVPVEISRFTAFALSLRSAADIDAYLAQFIASEKFEAMAMQLLFAREEARAFERSARAMRDPQRAFLQTMRQPRHVKKILARAAQMRSRFTAYLRQACDPQPGDRLVLVDLGYAGTVQDRVAPVLRELFDVDVCGRYLLLRDLPAGAASKRGFIGPDKLDGRAIDTLCDFIALFEQLCTVEQGSVVDYDEAGGPVRRDSGLASRQSEVRRRAQDGCLAYATAAVTAELAVGTQALRASCTGTLARLLFMPTDAELALFKGFEHDVNMGVDDKVLLFDTDACRDGLRSRGLFYVNDNPRQFLPAELRTQGLPLTLTLLAQRRFGLDLRQPDFGGAALPVPVMIADATRSSVITVEAAPTHDGYHVALIPIGACEYSVGILFGRNFERVQLHDALITTQHALYRGGDRSLALDVLATGMLEGAHQEPDGVFVFDSDAGFLYFDAPALPRNQNYVLSVSFRPLQRRVPVAQPDERPAATAAAR